MSGEVLFGVSGWDYRDWYGPIYPAGSPRHYRPLPLLARFLDFMEVNVSFYRILPGHAAERWVDETPESFRFVVKAWRGWTHDGVRVGGEETRQFQELLAPMADAERLEGVLAQFPPSFQDTPESRGELRALRDALAPVPVFVEVRRRALYERSFLGFLETSGLGFVNVDLPDAPRLPRPTRINTGPSAFLRLHGRNRKGWTDAAAGRDTRYDYLYEQDEVSELLAIVETLLERAPRVLVTANNHFQAHAPAAMVMMRSLREGRRVPAPQALIASHPELASHATPLEDLDAADRS